MWDIANYEITEQNGKYLLKFDLCFTEDRMNNEHVSVREEFPSESEARAYFLGIKYGFRECWDLWKNRICKLWNQC